MRLPTIFLKCSLCVLSIMSVKKKPDGRRRGYEYLIKDRRGEIDPETGRELIFDRSFRGDLALQYRVIA